MQYMSKMLVASGLAFMAGPFCLKAMAQGYVDVEAERAAAKSQAPVVQSAPAPSDTSTTPAYGAQPQAAPRDPYATQPAQTYPTTSYGLNNAPAATTAATAPPSMGDTTNVGNLLYQVQQLQQEVMQLNGKIEEQAFEIRTLKEQSLERYVDLDRRVSALSGGGSTAVAPTTGPAPSGAADGGGAAAQPGEADAYRAAYALVRGQQFNEAVGAFNQFLRDYPAGKFAPNAHYWLGELYLVIQPPDPESARQSFQLLIDQYPDNAKVPDALYKLGRVHFMKGNRERSREYLDRVIAEYGASNDAAVKLAQDFIAENF